MFDVIVRHVARNHLKFVFCIQEYGWRRCSSCCRKSLKVCLLCPGVWLTSLFVMLLEITSSVFCIQEYGWRRCLSCCRKSLKVCLLCSGVWLTSFFVMLPEITLSLSFVFRSMVDVVVRHVAGNHLRQNEAQLHLPRNRNMRRSLAKTRSCLLHFHLVSFLFPKCT